MTHPHNPRLLTTLASLAILLAVGGCASEKKPNNVAATQTTRPANPSEVPALWKLRSARRQSSYAKMDLPVIIKGTKIQAALPTGPAPWLGNQLALFSTRIHRTSVEGPMVDQLTAGPKTGSDGGSYLLPLPQSHGDASSTIFDVNDPFPLYMKIDVAAAQDPGTYRIPISILSPGRLPFETAIEIEVSDIALPTEPRVLGCITTTTAELAKIYPQSFGVINGIYLDRADPDDTAAVQQLDELVKAAQRNGVALFVEDIGPRVKLDNVGEISVDWDAYDRVMQPYMDGSAFPDRIPAPVWLAPVPPRRLRDSATQLRQYVAACADHFAAKGWVATPAFMHPALAGGGEPDEAVDEKLRTEISRVLKLHMTRDMLAVSTPDAAVPQARLWVVNDSDPRMPPAGALATEQSVRLWPWVTAARAGTVGNPGVKGFVWRNALAKAGGGDKDEGWSALLMASSTPPATNQTTTDVYPSLRLAWLNQGLNDTALLGLLEKRSDATLVNEVIGGIVGRTGLNVIPKNADIPTAPAGYLYAGWPLDKTTWDTLPGMLEKLVLANEPGQRVTVAPDDPLYIAAKLWLAKAHRPVARVAGYRFSTRPGPEGAVIDAVAELLVENPVDAGVDMEARFTQLPGDFELAPAIGLPRGQRDLKMPPYGMDRLLLPFAGHLDALLELPRFSILQLAEKSGGSILRLPVQLPIYRMKIAQAPPKIDGKATDWPIDVQTRTYGLMPISARYLARPDLLTGTVRREQDPATVRWSYDDNFLYALVRCPQQIVSDERNTTWPDHDGGSGGAGEGARWWGTDGIQIQLATLPPRQDSAKPLPPESKVFSIAFKPGGVVMVRAATAKGPTLSKWTDGPPGVNYGIAIEKEDGRVKGYVFEAAIPRKWFNGADKAPGIQGPALRVNVLRHRASDLSNTSWSGPIVNDDDISMMGLLVGNE